MKRCEAITVLAVDVSSGDEELYQDFTGTHPRRVVEGRTAGVTASVEVTTVWTPENLTDDMKVAFQNSSVRGTFNVDNINNRNWLIDCFTSSVFFYPLYSFVWR